VIAQVPHLYDGGYWYLVEADTSDVTTIPVESGWCANYGTVNGTVYGIARLIEQSVLPQVSVTFEQVLSAAVAEGNIPASSKFFARIMGA